MMAPAVTVCPANTFTPSRWACESRPFFDEPSPFLCAIGGLLRLACGLLARRPLRLRGRRLAHRLDGDPRQLRAVPAGLLEPAPGLEREHLDLLAPQVLDDRGLDGAVELAAVGDDVVAAGHQHLRRERVARGMRLPVDQEPLALLDAVLLASDLDDGVHERAG